MGYKENKIKYIAEYKRKNLKRVPLELPLEMYSRVKEHSQEHSETVNGFIKRAINETMERDNS